MSILFIGLIGLVMGSFLGVLIDRLPQDESIGGRSHCDYCGKPLRPLDLIPVCSYFMLGGKTSCCKKPLSLFYPLIELTTAAAYLFVYFWLVFSGVVPSMILLAFYCAIVSALIVILFADMKYHIIPDEMNIVLIFVALLMHIYMSSQISELLGFFGAGLAVGGSMLALFLITKGKGLGFGDVKFAFIMGFLLGLEGGFIALYISFILGGVISTILLLSKKSKMKTKIAFGPFLIIGTVSMIFFGEKIISIFHDLFV
jgi:leader peptidase (prepilin peptidase)/N-methyltransferase